MSQSVPHQFPGLRSIARYGNHNEKKIALGRSQPGFRTNEDEQGPPHAGKPDPGRTVGTRLALDRCGKEPGGTPGRVDASEGHADPRLSIDGRAQLAAPGRSAVN
ncbi:MAG TPA: hypothetical protein VHE61_06135 [Opitutaceae bacterium]|nr:hypothetical protein [Opitutaceae bacterium]